MFQFEKEMIPVLIEKLSMLYHTNYFLLEFNSGNGVADLVFTTEMSNESLMLNDYGMMSLFTSSFLGQKEIHKESLYKQTSDKARLERLLAYLEGKDYIDFDEENILFIKQYKPHTKNLIAIEAKLKDWKSGFYQALRYQFFSHQTFLAYPSEFIHRIDLNLLKEYNIGLISVDIDEINIIINPKEKKPKDITSYYFLSENFARNFKTEVVSRI
jgi:hypothetical protein